MPSGEIWNSDGQAQWRKICPHSSLSHLQPQYEQASSQRHGLIVATCLIRFQI